MNEDLLRVIREEVKKEYKKQKDLFEDDYSIDTVEYIKSTIKKQVLNRFKNEIDETNNVYLKIGDFHLQDGIEYKSPVYPQYSKYKNLENNIVLSISNNLVSKFENENTIIYPITAYSNQEFEVMKNYYMNAIIEEGNEKAVERIKKFI